MEIDTPSRSGFDIVINPDTVARALRQGYQILSSDYRRGGTAMPFQYPRRANRRPLPLGRGRPTATPGGTVRVLRRQGGATNSKSTGFLKKGPSSKKYKKKKLIKTAVLGCNRTVETSKVQTGTDTVWIGHATFARDQILRQAVVAMFYKVLYIMMYIRETCSINDPIPPLLQNTTLVISYRIAPASLGANATYTVPAGGTTLALLTDWFLDAARPWMQSTTNYEVEFVEIEVVGSGQGIGRHLTVIKDSKVKVYVKTAMKIQNRTKVAATDPDQSEQADVVDNVPLYGKSYSGKGSGLRARLPFGATGQDMDLLCDRQFGTILGSENLPGRNEPPQPKDFMNVKNCGKIHLDPGEIKTSVLTHSHTMKFNDLFRICANSSKVSEPAPAVFLLSGQRIRNIGKYRVFCIEKMIDVGTDQAISVAFENNMEISAQFILSRKKLGVVKDFAKYQLA